MSVQSQKLKLEEEDASLLKLGPDFSTANCLMNSEVEILLRAEKEQSEEDEIAPVTLKTFNYVERFSRFRKNREQVKEVRNALSKYNLHEFEIATLSNLCPDKADEAKTLIPTLAEKFEDDNDLQNILEEIKIFVDQGF